MTPDVPVPAHAIAVKPVETHAGVQYHATCTCGWADYTLRYSPKAAEMDGAEHIEWTRGRG